MRLKVIFESKLSTIAKSRFQESKSGFRETEALEEFCVLTRSHVDPQFGLGLREVLSFKTAAIRSEVEDSIDAR